MGAPQVGAHAVNQDAMKFRLPTDQLQTIINALSPPKQVANVRIFVPNARLDVDVFADRHASSASTSATAAPTSAHAYTSDGSRD